MRNYLFCQIVCVDLVETRIAERADYSDAEMFHADCCIQLVSFGFCPVVYGTRSIKYYVCWTSNDEAIQERKLSLTSALSLNASRTDRNNRRNEVYFN